MAVMYTHSVFLRFLLIFVLLDVTGGIVSSTKGHYRRKDFPGKTERLHNVKQQEKFQNGDIFKEVVSQTRTTVVLHCNTSRLIPPGKENITVIWVKINNDSFTILTDGDRVLTEDKRFFASNKTNAEDWSLYIRYARWEDEGLYKCQICASSEFSNSIYVKLKLREANAEIIGDPVRFVDKVGSPLRLSCRLNNSMQAPRYIYWYHGDRVINFDLNDGATVREGRQGSELIFPRAEVAHAGNYSCVPSNARQASVMVIINAKTSVGKNDEKGGKKSHLQDSVNVLMLIWIFLVQRVVQQYVT